MRYADLYDEMLNDVYGDVTIGGLKYPAAQAMKEVDPTAYRCGFNDWTDAESQNDWRVLCDHCGCEFEPDINEITADDPVLCVECRG